MSGLRCGTVLQSGNAHFPALPPRAGLLRAKKLAFGSGLNPCSRPVSSSRQLVMLREPTTTDVVGAKEALNGSLNGNGNGNGAGLSSNGNGNGNGASNGKYAGSSSNGTSAYNGTNQAAPVSAASSSENGNGNGKASPVSATSAQVNATAAPASASDSFRALSTASLDEAMDAGAAGQIESVAAQKESSKVKETAAGTPYKNPGGRWSQFRTYSVWQRTCEIWTFAFQFAIKYILLGKKFTYGKEGMTKEAVSQKKKDLAIWLREGLVKLGPTFIKIGQQFSTRVDVLSPEFVKELEKLQDNVPPFDSATAVEKLEASLGKPVNEVFEEFDPQPIAAASLGQVHLAKVKGQRVVVKIQRPGLKDLFDIDLKNIRALAVWLQKVDPKTDGAARDWVAIYDECSRILYQEIDYRLEGQNADRFRNNFAGVDWVKVPQVYWEYSSSEVLVLEYCPGTKINDAAALDAQGLDRSRLARLAVESYLQQILRHGFFHADPHPGNVAVDAVGGGRLVYYDFGMMGAIPSAVKGGLLDLFYGVYSQDPDKCLAALTTMGVYVPTGDRTAVRRTAEYFLRSFQERLQEQRKEREARGKEYSAEFKPQRSKDEAKERRRQILTSIGEDLLVASADQPFRFPATFTFVVRAFTVLDGIGKSLDARFDISEISAPYARELLLEGRPKFQKVVDELKKRSDNQNRAVVNLFKAPNALEEVSTVVRQLERGDLKLRVRALEAERALTRMQAWQRVLAASVAASTLINVGTVLSVSSALLPARLAFAGAAFFGLMVLKNYLKVASLEKKELQLLGAA